MKFLFRIHAILFLTAFSLFARGERDFVATRGFVKAKDLKPDFQAVVDSVAFRIYDAFEGSRTHSDMEETLFEIGNKLHIKSKPKTIQRRLLFQKGDPVTRELLLETERRLRKDEFLADAIIEAGENADGTAVILVTVYDQFSTIPAWGVQKPGDDWTFWFGPVESNLIGTGQKVSLFYSHDIDRDSYMAHYENKAFISNSLQLSGLVARTSDGFDYDYSLSKPLLSKTQKWGFEVNGAGTKFHQYRYKDADDPDMTSDKGVIDSIYRNVVDLSFYSSLTRSFGHKHKLLLSPVFSWKERYQENNPGGPRDGYELDFRIDYLTGLSISYYQSEYKTVKNFRNLKWSENLDVGFRVSGGIYQNLKMLGARNSDLYLRNTLVYINAWQSKHFLSTSLNTSTYLGYDGDKEDGTVTYLLEYQWKPVPLTSTYFSSNWKHYFNREKSSQLVLGGEQGLNGYPNRYFAGQARLLMEAEQRYFPDIEFGTAVPALAVFVNAGDAFDSRNDFKWDKLHYSAGFGLRIGATRSVSKLVNHINIAFPLDSKYRDILKTWKFTLLAKTNL